jgi:glycosyltransferase involved in cell wall biosynthesis
MDHTPSQRNLRIFALTFGGPDSASTQYRVLQYAGSFAAAGIELHHAPASQFTDWSSLATYDAVLLQKTLLSGSKLKALRKHSRRLLYDADDLIWLSPQKKHHWITRLRIESRLRGIAKSADLCVAANQVIAADLRARGAAPVVIPMALCGAQWRPADRPAGPVTIGWSGSPKNLPFLQGILSELIAVQNRFPEVIFAIHSGVDPKFAGLRFRHVPFRPNEEPQTVGQFHIGLLPLPDDPFARGKSPIKALQYFACGVATVGTPIGATNELLEHGKNALCVNRPADWGEHLARLITDAATRDAIAAAGRQTFALKHDAARVFGQLRGHCLPGASAT